MKFVIILAALCFVQSTFGDNTNEYITNTAHCLTNRDANLEVLTSLPANIRRAIGKVNDLPCNIRKLVIEMKRSAKVFGQQIEAVRNGTATPCLATSQQILTGANSVIEATNAYLNATKITNQVDVPRENLAAMGCVARNVVKTLMTDCGC